MPTILAVIFTLRSVYSKKNHMQWRDTILQEKNQLIWNFFFYEESLTDAWSKATLNQISTQIIPTTLKPFYAASHRTLRKKTLQTITDCRAFSIHH